MAKTQFFKKWAKRLNKHFFNRDRHTAIRHMQSCSTLFTLGEIQIKTTMRSHIMAARMAIIKKDTIQVLVKMWRKLHPLTLLVGMQNGAANLENGLIVPQKFNIELACDPTIIL